MFIRVSRAAPIIYLGTADVLVNVVIVIGIRNSTAGITSKVMADRSIERVD